MKTISDNDLLQQYIRESCIEDYFGFDIRQFLTLCRFEESEQIITEGDVPGGLYFLVKGRAKVHLSQANGKVTLVRFMEAPSFIGEMEMIQASTSAHGVTAITECLCIAIDTKRCSDRILQDPVFLRRLCFILGRKTVVNTENFSKIRSYPLDVRLADFILMTSSKGYYREKHVEVAEYLGVSYRHLLYVIADFVKKGYLEKRPQGYFIREEKALRALADHKKG